jgi:hypothetical protein
MSHIDDDEFDDEDEDHLADRVLLQTWQEWRRKVSREVAETEAVAVMMAGDSMFGGVALRDLEREDREWRRRRPLLFRNRPAGAHGAPLRRIVRRC